MQTLLETLTSQHASPRLNRSARWRTARPADVPALAAEIRRWQSALTKFNSVAHFKPWIDAVNPIAESQTFRLKIYPPPGGGDVVLRLITRDAGDGSSGDYVVWDRPRLEAPGRPELAVVRLARRAPRTRRQSSERLPKRRSISPRWTRYGTGRQRSISGHLRKPASTRAMLAAWCDYLGIADPGTLAVDGLFIDRIESGGRICVCQGLGHSATPSVVANSSDQEVRIPGTLKPHSIAVHPSPTQNVAVGWRSPMRGRARVEAKVIHAHPACGNGVSWSLEKLRRGSERRRLAGGEIDCGKAAKIDPIDNLGIESGDLISLVIGPRRNDHACDLTHVDLTIRESIDSGRSWNLSRDVSGAILSGNPHADSQGNRNVWYFYQEKLAGGKRTLALEHSPRFVGSTVGAMSRRNPSGNELADRLQQLLMSGPSSAKKDNPDTVLDQQLKMLLAVPSWASSTSPRSPVMRPDWMPVRTRPAVAIASSACLVNSSAGTRWASLPNEPV